MPDDSVSNVGQAPICQEYLTEIVSVLKFNKDQAYFSYIHLFGFEVYF